MTFKRYVITMALTAITGILCAAESTTTTLSVSAQMKANQTTKCTPTDCTQSTALNISASHTFTITPEEMAGLQPDTSVTLSIWGNQIPLILSDDPAFLSGASSAEIIKTVPVISVPVQCKVRLAWDNGQFTISLKGKGVGSTSYPNGGIDTLRTNSAAAPTKVNPGPPPVGRQDTTFFVETNIQRGDTNIVDAYGYFAADTNENIKASQKADGSISGKVSISRKSRYPVLPPPCAACFPMPRLAYFKPPLLLDLEAIFAPE
jgi:hypothetical protein